MFFIFSIIFYYLKEKTFCFCSGFLFVCIFSVLIIIFDGWIIFQNNTYYDIYIFVSSLKLTVMTTKQFNEFKKSANKAKTKYDMCYHMDRMNWKSIPWVHLMLGVLDKSSIKAEYEVFLFDLNS